MRSLLVALVLCALSASCRASDALSVSPTLAIPADSATRVQIVRELSLLVEELNNGVVRLAHIDSTKAGTRLLLDDMTGLRVSKKYNDPVFYKAQLVNVVPIADSAFHALIAYIGVHDSSASLRVMMQIRVELRNGIVNLSTDFERKVATWKQKSFGTLCFHFKERLNDSAAKAYATSIMMYDSLLNATEHGLELYCCDDLKELLSLYGIDFISDYAGRPNGSSTVMLGKSEINLNSFGGPSFGPIDPHDLWHARLRRVENMKNVNKAVDEGCAFLYGGSWGLSWPTIQERFRAWSKQHSDVNWLNEYKKSTNIAEKGGYPLVLEYILNAYVVREIQQKQGFGAVRNLLRCGARQKDDRNYFEALEHIAGISEARFNEWIAGLIKN